MSYISIIKYCSCKLKGVAPGCYVKDYRRSLHVSYAYRILEYRWDIENYLVLGPVHASRRLPFDKSKTKEPNSASVEPLDCNPLKIDRVLQEKLETTKALALGAGTGVHHTLFLNAISANDLQMLYENALLNTTTRFATLV
ncbi:hypothetical protein IEQ34_007572 [Dendrobium chrysotoxum]|uniref:Uncharacterized protein n=1 Tax=Dendrobium chrysotoxum TaxID=161865 RepID=A0AAV7GM93_DENCH|nr:hypothetical protein IEQ34_007572 [Dendrobium chrysotoxum]